MRRRGFIIGRLALFLGGFVLGGVFVFASLKYHIVKAEDGTHMVPKMGATFSQTYVDVRGFAPQDWSERPELAAAVVRAGKSHLLKDAAVDSLFDGAEGLLKALQR